MFKVPSALNTLYAKLLAVLVGLTVILAVMFLVIIRYSDIGRNQEINQKVYGHLAARLVQDEILAGRDHADPGAVQKIFDRIRVVNPRIDVYLLDATGRIVAAAADTKSPQLARVDLEPIQRFLDGKSELPIPGEDPAEVGRKRAFSVSPVPLSNGAGGYLYLVFRGLSANTLAAQIKQSYVMRETVWLVACGLLVALIASILLITTMTRPLRQLSEVMEKFRRGGYAGEPETLPRPRDEIGHITDTCNRMADRILDQMSALKQTDAMRRELVANISHDLRTPLASLQGYLETLQLKRNELSDAEQRNYLDIALKQTEQLSRLIERLFDLAKLDSGQVVMTPEPFAIADLIQDVAQDFELAAANKRVRLGTAVRPDVPLVLADVGLMERVLRNLIDNALRYTGAGGKVTIAAKPGADRAIIEVADTGTGIPPDDLSRIFDRFYRAEKSRALSGGNAGLGLAITKRILDLHDSTIGVASEPGKTVFHFTLPYAAVPGGDPRSAGDRAAKVRVPSLAYPMARPSA